MNSTSDKAPEFETYILKPLRIRFSQVFGRYTLEKMKVDTNPLLNHVMDAFELQITTNILGQSRTQIYSVEINVPDGWWEQFKFQHLPSWWQHRWPIKWKTVKRKFALDHWALLPKFDKVPPGEEVVMFTQVPGNEPGIKSL